MVIGCSVPLLRSGQGRSASLARRRAAARGVARRPSIMAVFAIKTRSEAPQ